MAVHYCELCRRSSFAGRRHLYSAGHRRRLQEALAQLQEAVAAARAAAAAGGEAALRPYDPAEHGRRVWCLVCGRGVRRDGRSGGMALPQAGLLRHLAGWRPASGRPSAGSGRRCGTRCRWVSPALPPGTGTGTGRRGGSAGDQRYRCFSLDQLQAEPEPGAGPPVGSPPAPPGRNPRDAEQPGPSGTQTGPDFSWMESGQALTFIGHQETEGKGNVHTGAKPPWLMEEEEDGSKQQIGPSYEEFLKQKEKQKLKKLPAERVGANFDHTSQTGESWLPSFGRVWNHGRRWQSRHQFRTESGEKKKKR
ncbi:centrosomal AT-AC splicing factor isoform X2 [Rissa tridactyla]|uniref:centrosomal AT-AC splicing factor isoform X2 n=1 Tax=Rissa tridactyla TaxID=75485 RepID=UPI0023BAC8D0|nr:centrosomal AT-AC splicing factor isoform X2 [Rissa tridactyla]